MRLDIVPWLNVLALGWALTLLNSSFIYAPGIVMGLPPLNLPSVPASALSGQPVLAEVTILPPINQNQLFIFESGPYTMAKDGKIPGLQEALTAKRKNLRDSRPGAPAVLLLKADANVTEQTFLTIIAMAQAAGFTSTVRAAAEEAPSANTPLSAVPRPPSPVATDGNVSAH
jgi:biopolymer transport protein ExbD